MTLGERYMEKNEKEYLLRDLELLKNTINNLNFAITTLKESNMFMSMKLDEIDKEIDEKSSIIASFLEKNNLSIEDVYEYESELKLKNNNKKKKKKT